MAYQGWVPEAYFTILVLGAILSLVVAYWAQRTQEFRGQRLFSLMTSIGITWGFIAAMHIVTEDPTVMRWIVRLELGHGMAAALTVILFCSKFTNRELHRRRWFHLVSGGAFLLYGVGIVFNPWELMFTQTPLPIYEEPFSHASAERGPLYLFLLLIAYIQAIAAVSMLFQFLFSTHRDAKARMFLLGTGVPSILALNTLSILDWTPIPTFEHAAVGILPFMLCLTLSLFGLGSFKLAPVARSTLIETLDDGMIALDGSGNIADYNPQATELAPSLAEHRDNSLETVLPELATLIDEHDVETVLTDELWLDTENGERYYSVRVSPVTGASSEAELLGYSILLRDITELERSRQELQRQNEQLDQFASIVSHDLRNPLTVANGYVDILEANAKQVHDEYDVDPALFAGPLAEIKQSHDRMEAITEDMLTLTQEGQSVEETESLDFAAVARDAWSNVDTREASLALETGGRIQADRSRLLSIFENLFRNSLDHVGGAVTVSAGLTDTGFYVADDGPGIPEEHADDILEYGYTTSEEGTGLGLSIVETMANSHGWSVELDRAYDDGTRFVFTDASVTVEESDSPDSLSAIASHTR